MQYDIFYVAELGCGIYDVLYEDVITANSAKPVLTASDFQERSNGALPGRPVHINIRFQVCQGLGLPASQPTQTQSS